MYAIGEYIRKLRKLRDISQAALADRLGMSRPLLVNIEKGQRDVAMDEARKFSEVLEITFDDFCAHRMPDEPEVLIRRSQKKSQKQPAMRISVPQKHLDKFKEVLLYILGKVGAKPNVGETVLYKLLYFIDFDFYEKYEHQLIGATYMKNHYGPTPIEFKVVLKDMQQRKEIEPIKSQYYQHEQRKYLPLRKADLSILSAKEKEHIDEVLARLSNKSAKEISAYSHKDVPWITAEQGQPISYESVFYRTDSTSVRPGDGT